MTKCPPSCEQEIELSVSVLGPTLADVLARVPNFEGVSVQSRQNMASSIRTLCRVGARNPSLISIDTRLIRNIMDQAPSTAVDLSPSHWRNVKSDVRRAIRLSCLTRAGQKCEVPLTERWQKLLAKVCDNPQRSTIRRFAQFCTSCQITPEDIDDQILHRYQAFLEATQLYRNPARSVYVLAWAWNKHVAAGQSRPYKRLNAPNRSRKYALDWADLPKSLAVDVTAFHESCQNPDPLEQTARRPASPVTIKGRDFLLRRYAAALVARGIDKDDLKTLSDMFRLDRLKEGLRFFLDRNDNKPCGQIVQIINLALVVARRWAILPPEEVDEIKALARRLRRTQKGLTERNRNRLRQFADDAVLDRLLRLPRHLVSDAGKRQLSYRVALKVQMALAIEILIFAPIRIGNLLRLDRNRHFHWARFDGQRVLHLVIPEAEVKNDVDLEFPLPTETVTLLDLYMGSYQPALVRSGSSSLLFPGRDGGSKNQPGLSRQISATIKRETGLVMNPHLFRHLGAHLFLERHPGSYEEVRRVLGHKKIDTTIENYAGLETAAAVRRFDDVILERRAGPPTINGRRWKQG
jgi:integrase